MMRKGLKITIGVFTVVILFIAFIGFFYFWYWRNSRIAQADTYDGERLMYAHKTQEAINMLEKALIRDPYNTHTEKLLVDLYFGEKQYRNVIDMQTTQLKKSPDDIWDYKRKKRLGEAYLAMGDLNSAQRVYEEFYKRYNDSPSGPLGIATVYERKGNLKKAIEFREQGIVLMKRDIRFTPKSVFNKEIQKLITLYKQTGQEDQANKLSQELQAV